MRGRKTGIDGALNKHRAGLETLMVALWKVDFAGRQPQWEYQLVSI